MTDKFAIDMITLWPDENRADLRGAVRRWLVTRVFKFPAVEWIIEKDDVEYSLRPYVHHGDKSEIIVASISESDGVLFRLMFPDFRCKL